jgi:TolA-binding protein
MPRTATRTPPSSPAPAEPEPRACRRPARLGLALAACAVLAGAAQAAVAQVSLDEPPLDEHDAKRIDRIEKAVREMRAILFQGRETGAPVVVQPADTEAQIGRFSDRLTDIEQTLAKLNGELEVVRHDLDQSHHDLDELRTANTALADRVTALEKTVQSLTAPPPAPPAAAAPQAAASAPAAPPPADPSADFAAARAAFEQDDMATAEAGFRAYLAEAGDGPRAPEARYYLARTLISRHAWPDAATADIGAIRGWPHTPWAPLAVLDLSRSLVAMNKTQDACETLGELSRRYPKAAPATLREASRLRVEAKCG